MNVLDMRGPDFLMLYLLLLAGGVVFALILREVMRRVVSSDMGEVVHVLDSYEAAFLSGGEVLALHAALASLVQRSILNVGWSSGVLTVASELPGKSHPVEEQVYGQVAARRGITVNKLKPRDYSTIAQIRDRLEQDQLVFTAGAAAFIRFVPLLMLLGVIVLGAMKVWVGISRGRPVAFLVMLTIMAVILAVVMYRRNVLRTPAGDRLLSSLKQKNAGLETTTKVAADRLSGDDVAMAVGLFGTGILAGAVLGDLNRALHPVVHSGNSSGSGCGASSCGSSCGGGCGGGGCGGCGGCGG